MVVMGGREVGSIGGVKVGCVVKRVVAMGGGKLGGKVK